MVSTYLRIMKCVAAVIVAFAIITAVQTPLDSRADTEYSIGTYDELRMFIEGINDGTIPQDTDAKLTDNIVVPERVGNDWVPLAKDMEHEYKGTFDGQFNKISGIKIDRIYPEKWSTGEYVNSYTAFISFLGEGGVLKNLNLEASIKDVNDVAGFVSQNSGTIEYCRFKGSISSSVYPNGGSEKSVLYPDGVFRDVNGESGCIAALNLGTIYECETEKETKVFRGGDAAGGICGQQSGAAVTKRCRNYADVEVDITGYPTSAKFTGGADGIAGQQEPVFGNPYVSEEEKPLITECINYGRISGWQCIGGICGDSGLGDITECTNDFDGEVVNVTGNMAGGICGYFSTSQRFMELGKASTISDCQNSGDVNVPQGSNKSEFIGSQIGGICGYAEDNMILTTSEIAPIRIMNCRNDGEVYGRFGVGGVIGFLSNALNEDKMTNVYELINMGEVKGHNHVGGVAGNSPGALASTINYGNVRLYPKENNAKAGGIVGDGSASGILSTSYNIGNISTENPSGYKVLVGGVAGAFFKDGIKGAYSCNGLSGEAKTAIGSNTNYKKGMLDLPDMAGENAKTSMPELFDEKSGFRPDTKWCTLENQMAEYRMFYMTPQITSMEVTLEDIRRVRPDRWDTCVDSIAHANVTIEEQTYTGEELTPVVNVKMDGKTLVEGTDYDICNDPDGIVSGPYIDAGSYKIELEGKGDYIGKTSGDFIINKVEVKVTAPSGKTFTYNGKSKTGVASGSHYTLSGTVKATKAGTYTAKATLKSAANYAYIWSDKTTAVKSIKWTIKKAANPLSVKGKKATVKGCTKGKHGKLKKKKTLKVSKVISFKKKGQGKITYTKASGNKKITINKTSGKVTVKKGLKKGTYKVKVKAKAAGNTNYKASGLKTVTFKINLR